MIALVVLIFAVCSNKAVVLGKPQMYEVTSDIHSLDVQINAADFIIVHGDKFSVESNLKNLTVSERDGVLTIEEKAKVGTNYTNAMLKLCEPGDTVFEEVKISTGAAKLTADSLSANFLTLKLGQAKSDLILSTPTPALS